MTHLPNFVLLDFHDEACFLKRNSLFYRNLPFILYKFMSPCSLEAYNTLFRLSKIEDLLCSVYAESQFSKSDHSPKNFKMQEKEDFHFKHFRQMVAY